MFDKKIFITVVVAVVVVSILNRLFLDSAMDKFLPSSNYEDLEDA